MTKKSVSPTMPADGMPSRRRAHIRAGRSSPVRSCPLSHRAIVCTSPEREFLNIDELERETVCRARGCHDAVRLSMVRLDELTGFVGGLA